MRLFLLNALASVTALVATAGCDKPDHGANIPTVTVDQLDQLLAQHAAQPVDANEASTRREMGTIPGAVLLDSYDAIDKLPADKTANLVFYCANTSCGASHEAAEKALTAGYTHVQVLPDGIAGWVKAGKKVRSLSST